MKTMENIQENLVGPAPELRFGHQDDPVLPARDKQSLIQWTIEQQIQEVSKQLASIKEVAIHLEVTGNYHKSGDLAYQIQQIIRATAELFKKSQRAKG